MWQQLKIPLRLLGHKREQTNSQKTKSRKKLNYNQHTYFLIAINLKVTIVTTSSSPLIVGQSFGPSYDIRT
jgi:hypothetical protein